MTSEPPERRSSTNSLAIATFSATASLRSVASADVTAFAIAVPYCDVVVTEKSPGRLRSM